MPVISALRSNPDWANLAVDESGQWIQDSGATAAHGNTNESGAFSNGWTETPWSAPAQAPEPAPAPVAAPATTASVTLASPLQAASTSDVTAAASPAPAAANGSPITAAWDSLHSANPYRFYQQMSEHGWSVADVASATGQSEQAVGDYLTRIGAQAGFGGEATLGRGAVNAGFVAGLAAAPSLPDTSRPWWQATERDENGEVVVRTDESGATSARMGIDVAAYARWYASQDTEEARTFVRIHGQPVQDSAGVVRFSTSGAVVASGGLSESGDPQPATLSWDMDGRINAYQTYNRMNLLQQAAMQVMVQSPENQEIVRVFGNGAAALPDNEMGERMRALYGTELATQMLQLTQATDAMKAYYLDALNGAMRQMPSARAPSGPYDESGVYVPGQPMLFSAAVLQARGVTPGETQGALPTGQALPPGWHTGEVLYDEDGLGHQQYTFSAADFHNWFIRQDDPRNRALGTAYGEATAAADGGYRTHGTLESLSIGVTFDESGTPTQAVDRGLAEADMARVDLSNPPDLYDNGQVYFMPMLGFVTPTQNIKPDEDWFEKIIPLIIVAVVAYFSAGTLGPAAAGAMGLTTTAASGAVVLTTAGVMVSAAVAGAATSMVSGMMSGNLTFKGILQGALAGALTAGMFRGVELLTNTPISGMGTVANIATRTTVQGAVQALMGGSFRDGAIAGFAAGLGSALSTQLNTNIAEAAAAGTMTPAEVTQARYFANMMGASIRIVASGASHPGYALASAFLDQVLSQVAPPDPSLPSSDFIPAPTPAAPPTAAAAAAQQAFDSTRALVIEREGGLTANPLDPANDRCVERAEIVMGALLDRQIPAGRIELVPTEGGLLVYQPTDGRPPVSWGEHHAVVADFGEGLRVIDHAVSDTPLTIEQWSRMANAGQRPVRATWSGTFGSGQYTSP